MRRSLPFSSISMLLAGGVIGILASGCGGKSKDNPAPNVAPIYTSKAPSIAVEAHEYSYAVKLTDANGDALTLTLSKAPTGAKLTNGTLSWTPTSAQVGVAQDFEIKADDGKGGVTVQSWTLTPTANQTPVFSTQAPTNAKEAHAYQYACAASDADNDAISYTLVNAPTGASLSNGQIVWVPGSDQIGQSQTFTLKADDGHGQSAEQTWSVTPTANAIPSFTTTPSSTATTGQEYSYTPTAVDADNDALNFSSISMPSGAIYHGGKISWIPTHTQIGVAATFTIRATDAVGAVQDQSWTVTPVLGSNQEPSFTSLPPTHCGVGTAYSYKLVASDLDGDAVTYTLITAPSWASLAGSDIGGTPTATGDSSFTVRVTDTFGAHQDQSWTVNVSSNHPPIFTSTPPSTTDPFQHYEYTPTTSDPDGDAVTLSLVQVKATWNGLWPSSGIDAYNAGVQLQNGVLKWNPGASRCGSTYDITLRATDANGASTDQIVSLTFPLPTFSQVGFETNTLPDPRCMGTATRLWDGRILLVGSDGSASVSQGALLFDPATRTTTPAGTMINGGRFSHLAARVGNNVWIFGSDGSSKESGTTVECWDPTLNNGSGGFTAKTPMKKARGRFTLTDLGGGKFLVVGGFSDGTPQTPVAEVEVYDTTANGGMGSSTLVTSLTQGRFGHVAWKDGTKVYVAGGSASTGGSGRFDNILKTSEIIDITNLSAVSVSAGSDLLEPRVYAGNTGSFIFGGITGSDANNWHTLATSEWFNNNTGQFQAAAALHKPRAMFAMTQPAWDSEDAGSKNMAILAGGMNAQCISGTKTTLEIHDSIERYDPYANGGTGQWNLMPAHLAMGRSYGAVAATSFTTGELFVFGGNIKDPFSQTDQYSQAIDVVPLASSNAGTFSNTGNLIRPVKTGQLVNIGEGQAVLIGKNGPSGDNLAQIYDRKQNQWIAGPKLAGLHEDLAASIVSGENTVCIFGGVKTWGTFPDVTQDVSCVYRKTDGTFGGTALTPMLTGRVALTATLLQGGKALIVGGMDASNHSVAQIEIYQFGATSTTQAIGNLTTPVAYHMALLSGGQVYVVGGMKDPGLPTRVTPTQVQIIDPATGTVTQGAAMPDSAAHIQGIKMADGRLLIVGGLASDHSISKSCWIFDPTTNGGLGSFTATGSLNIARSGAALSLLKDGRVLVAGGRSVNDGTKPGVSSVEVFDPSANGGVGAFSLLNHSLSSTRAEGVATLLTSGEVLIVGDAISGQDPTAQGAYGELFE